MSVHTAMYCDWQYVSCVQWMCVVVMTAPGRPGKLSFIVTTPSSVLVTWTQPSPRPKGVITLYELSYYQDFRVDGKTPNTLLFCILWYSGTSKNGPIPWQPQPWRPQTMTATAMTATNHDGHSNENVKTNGVLLRNRQIHGEFTVIQSSVNRSVAVMVVAVMVCGRHGCGCDGLWPSWLWLWWFVAVIVEPRKKLCR